MKDDLISRQNAVRWVKTNCNPYGKPTLDYDSGIKVINHLEKMKPSDAVEVVRCKDCKHRFNGEHHDNCCDVLMEKVKWTFEVTVEPDWFCADGKRRNDG